MTINKIKEKRYKNLTKELKGKLIEEITTAIYRLGCYNEKIAKGLEFYEPEDIRIEITWKERTYE